MPLPPGIQNVVLRGTYLDSEGRPKRGYLKFKPTTPTAGSGVTIPADGVRATLNNQGTFTITLPTSDNTGLNPDGWTYAVRVFFEGGTRQVFSILLAASPSEQDIADLAHIAPVDPGTVYATKAELDDVERRLSYRHNQLVADSIWVILHNLGYMPNVQIFDSAHEEIIGSIEHDDETGLTIAFSAATGGYALLS
jgi:hypothetical protein